MSFFSSIPLWGWFDILFNVAVLAALCGESDWALKRLIPKSPGIVPSAEWRRKKLKKKFELLLILGITGEVACIPFSLIESAESNKLAGKANERAAKFEKESEELRKANDALEAEIQPRKITASQKNICKVLLRREFLRSPQMAVAIKVPQLDFEARLFAYEFADIFTNSGFFVGIDQRLSVPEEPYFGLTLIINPNPSITVRITTNAFKVAGITPDALILDKDIPENVLKIKVGTHLIR